MCRDCLGRVGGNDCFWGGRIVVGAPDIGVAALEEWASGACSAYIFWLDYIF